MQVNTYFLNKSGTLLNHQQSDTFIPYSIGDTVVVSCGRGKIIDIIWDCSQSQGVNRTITVE